MTIGIAVSGPRAGLAAVRALTAVEAIGRGAIRGFVSFAAIDGSGRLLRAETQNGGTRTLFDGNDPPPRIAEARMAALMSSGPNRPDPLSQFVAGDAAVGLVTGHRLPNMPGADGQPMNEAALAALAAGTPASDVIAQFQAANPDADAGIVVVDRSGRIVLGNSAAVELRDDKGRALYEDTASGLRVGVLHNLIFPPDIIAGLAVSAARDTVAPADAWDLAVPLTGGQLALAMENTLVLADDGTPPRITVTEEDWLRPDWEGSPILRGTVVLKDGKPIGHVVREPYCTASEGKVVGGRGGDTADIKLLPHS